MQPIEADIHLAHPQCIKNGSMGFIVCCCPGVPCVPESKDSNKEAQPYEAKGLRSVHIPNKPAWVR
jgi:hypothetical protein